MKEAEKFELEEIRHQIRQQTDVSTKVFAISIGIVVTFIGYIIEFKEVSLMFYFIPILIIIGGFLIILSRFQSIYRLATYQKVFLEKIDGVYYEHRFAKFRKLNHDKLSKFGGVISLLYSLLLFVQSFVFYSKGYNDEMHIILFLSVIILFYGLSRYYISLNKLNRYELIWEKVKEDLK